jgi:predicted ribosomally synthesized peptide with nif11-like leader
MAVKDVNAFFEKAAQDKNLQKKLKALAEREEAIYADLVNIASAAGFKFTTADARKVHAAAVRELSADELDAVAGGGGQGYRAVPFSLRPVF